MRKQGFTLLEVIVCVALLTFLLSAASLSGVRIIKDYKEKEKLKEIEARIASIHKFASVIHSSGHIHFENEAGSLVMQVSFYSGATSPIIPKQRYEHFSLIENELTIFFTPEGLPSNMEIAIKTPSQKQFLLKIKS